jgi:hypothetical protein
VSNYVSRWFNYTRDDVHAFLHSVEKSLMEQQREAETIALVHYHRRKNPYDDVDTHKYDIVENATSLSILEDFQNNAAATTRDKWHDFFYEMAGKYRDFHRILHRHMADFVNASSNMGYTRLRITFLVVPHHLLMESNEL